MNIQRLIDYISVAFTAGYSILLIAVFYLAYFDPTATVTICVDNYGEASIEFVLVSLSVPFVVYQIVGDTAGYGTRMPITGPATSRSAGLCSCSAT
jgi:hypothetical protein